MKRLLWGAFALLLPVDALADVGWQSSVAIGTDGLALISYLDTTNSYLKVAHCSNLACTSARVSTLDFGDGGTSIAIGGDGLGLIAYRIGNRVMVAHCANVECTSATRSEVFYDSSFRAQLYNPDLAVGADGLGLMVFAYRPDPRLGGSTILYGAHCLNPACTIRSLTVIDSSPVSLGVVTMGSDGLPLLAYAKETDCPACQTFLFTMHCDDVGCGGRSSARILPGNGPLDLAPGADGLGYLAWAEGGAGLQIARCADVPCSSATSTALAGAVGDAALAVASDGLPLVAHVSGDDLKVVHCNDPACNSSTGSLLDSPSQVTDNALAIGADGLGLISYHDAAAGVLKVAHCQDVACTSATITVPSPVVVPVADLSVQLSHFPTPIPGLQPFSYRIVSANLGPDDASNVSVALELPAAVVFQSASGTGWECLEAGGRVTCSRGLGSVGTLPEILVQVIAPPAAQVLSATATISTSADDPAPGNNTDTELAAVTGAQVADLAVAMSDGGAVVHPGQPFTWTITVSSLGPAAVSGAVVTDVFPATVSGVAWTCVAAGASCPASGTGDIVASVALTAGSAAVFTATGTLSPSTYVLSNTATIAPPSGYHDPNPADNTVTVASQPEPTQAYTLVPCRVVDTRGAEGPALKANRTRTFAVTGTCAVPADARAVMVNATAVAPGDTGNLRLYPTGATAPLASSLNFAPGRTRANNAVVPLGTDGQISVQCDMPPGSQASTHFVLDVYGYFK